MKDETRQDAEVVRKLYTDDMLHKSMSWAAPGGEAGAEAGAKAESGAEAEAGVKAESGAEAAAVTTAQEEQTPQKEILMDAPSSRNKEPREEKKGGVMQEIWEWVKIIVSAAAIAFFLNTFIIANSQVPSGSMENTIMTGDRVIGSRLSYKFSEPERGDIAIFRFPDNEKIYYVKRVIGLPGETVDIVDGKVYLNGSTEPLDEPYIREPMIPEAPMHYEVPEGCYFMMGDNRNYSMDARRWENTYVKKEKLIAKVLFRYYPKPGKLQ